MTKITAERLTEELENHGYDAFEYSGRGMYGKHCVAVRTKDINEMFQIGHDLALALIDQEIEVPNPVTDSLGTDVVIYWPKIKV